MTTPTQTQAPQAKAKNPALAYLIANGTAPIPTTKREAKLLFAWRNEAINQTVAICQADHSAAVIAAREGAIANRAEVAKVLNWALPLAKIAIESHRYERCKYGHDMTGTYRNGETWVGIYQTEVDQIEHAEFILALLRDTPHPEQGDAK